MNTLEAFRHVNVEIPLISGVKFNFHSGVVVCSFQDGRPGYGKSFGEGIPETVKPEQVEDFIREVKAYIAQGSVSEWKNK